VTNNALQKLKKELEEAQKKLSEYEKESKNKTESLYKQN